jgi:serine protease Do
MNKQMVYAPDWTQLQDVMQNAVVQVFSQVGRFNWLEPYKTDDETEARGSGFIINEDGYIVTNAHVIDEAKRVWVHIPSLGRQTIHVEIIGVCPARDLALLRIQPDQLPKLKKDLTTIPYLTFGDSDLVQRTDNVMVLGYPLGQYRLKSTTGIVSGREASNGQALIQMTASVNPGSSGGPMLNEQGHVIGITVASIIVATNVGYAIPINELKQILEELYTKRLVHLPVLGVQFVFSNDSKAEYLGNPLPAGLYITKVLKNSLFAQAGVQEGDMLYEFNGFRLDAYGDTTAPWGADKTSLTDLIARIKIGETIQMVLYRAGKRIEQKFIFQLMPQYPIRKMYPDYEEVRFETLGGMVIMELADNHLAVLIEQAPDLIKYARSDEKYEPVLVITSVLPGSLAHQLHSLLPGDTIKEVNDIKVSTLDSYCKALQKSITTGYVTLKTGRDIYAVFSLYALLDDEMQLSKDFVYPVSKTVEELLKKVEKNN